MTPIIIKKAPICQYKLNIYNKLASEMLNEDEISRYSVFWKQTAFIK